MDFSVEVIRVRVRKVENRRTEEQKSREKTLSLASSDLLAR